MRVITDIAGRPEGVTATALTIGVYDGVHLGHRAVLSEVCRQAAGMGVASCVVTFDPHPAEIVRPESAPHLLTDIDQRLELLASTGVDLAVLIHFDEARAGESAEDFVRQTLVGALGVQLVVVGEDFHFGRRRQGNVALLEEMGAELGFAVHGHHLVGPDGADALDEATVSSTAIRRALVEARLADANAMLGRPHEMRGPVVEGDRRGREVGFPTANVAIGPRMLHPADGIYAGHLVRATGERLPSAIYVGHRPTFYSEGAATVIESHCLGWKGDIYGERVGVTFEHRLRGDQRFDSVEELIDQLQVDCLQAATLLQHE
ncbi:MAG: bifunctional riboflavin kinase/FAD synthetase [Microthrixaceae bacterium]|nr:bifunctional riboflavin kinase/FAD synthetase [Microthrixaceae bacterium]